MRFPTLNQQECRRPILILTPKGLRHIAQGCRASRLPWESGWNWLIYPEGVAS